MWGIFWKVLEGTPQYGVQKCGFLKQTGFLKINTKHNQTLTMVFKLVLSQKPKLVLKLNKKRRRYYSDDNVIDKPKKKKDVFDRIDNLLQDSQTFREKCESLLQRVNELKIGKMDPSWLCYGDNSCMVIEDNNTCLEVETDTITDEDISDFLYDALAEERGFMDITDEEVVAFLKDVFDL